MGSARSTPLLAVLALCAFAANSLLCRAALDTRAIDATTFTSVRLVSGALLLAVLVRLLPAEPGSGGGSLRGALALAAYALCFSFAYLRIGAGVGALILFGCVQATMIGSVILRGEKLGRSRALGLVLALAGLAWLTLRNASAPDPFGAALMALAGVAWGIYTLLGRGGMRPIAATARNFLWSAPIGLAANGAALAFGGELRADGKTLALAIASGALASGVGYVLWYSALRGLSTSAAAIAQLCVPLITAVAAVLVLGETLNPRFYSAAALVLGGVALAVLSRRK